MGPHSRDPERKRRHAELFATHVYHQCDAHKLYRREMRRVMEHLVRSLHQIHEHLERFVQLGLEFRRRLGALREVRLQLVRARVA